MKHSLRRIEGSAAQQLHSPIAPLDTSRPGDKFGGPERDLYPRERFHAALNGEMTPEEYVADVQAFVDARIALDHPDQTPPPQKKN